jgi:hypothetical protein
MALNQLDIDSEQKTLIDCPILALDGIFITRAKTTTWLLLGFEKVSRWERKSVFGRQGSYLLRKCSTATEATGTVSTRLLRVCRWLVGLVYGVCNTPFLCIPHLPWLITIDRFPITTAARTAKTGLAVGLAYGLIQDALSTAKGRPPAYVDFVLGRSRRQNDRMEQMDQSGVV